MRRWGLLLPLAALVVLLLSGIAVAQTGNGYDLSWSTVDGGGYTFSQGSGYELGGTVGQPDAGALTGGHYTLGGGFWGSIVEYLQRIFLPLVLKNYAP